jgi:hemolysin activation/secretion protein
MPSTTDDPRGGTPPAVHLPARGRPVRPTRWRRALALVPLLPALPQPGWAQTPPDAGRLLQETRPAPQPTLPPSPPRLVDTPVRPTVTMPEGMTVQVSGFRITGAVSFPAERLAELTRPWVGRRLDIAGLNEAAGAITRHYQAAGHILSYAYLPAQRVADGTIEIAVLEGRLEATQIVTAQEVRLRDEVIQAHTDRLPQQPPLKQDDVERQLLLLNDIPGVTARAAFTPGASTGGADLVVSVAEDEPLVVRGEVNNHGSKSTGELRAGVGIQLRDLFGWGDATHARLLVSEKGGLVSGSLGTSVPFGGDGFRMGAALSHLKYQLSGPFRATGAVGSADVASVDATYPLVRSTVQNLWLRGAVEHKRLRDEVRVLPPTEPRADNAKRSYGVELGLNWDRRDAFMGGGASAASVAGTWGVLRLLSPPDAAADAATLGTAGDWHKLVLQLLRQQALGAASPWSVYGRVAAQGTLRNLDSSEKFALGGAAGVRAYGPGEATVDQGALATLELRYTQALLGGNVVWSLFHDAAEGRYSRRSALAGNEVRLRGGGFGLQWNAGDWGLLASLAWRGSRVPSEGADPHPRLYFQFSLNP